MFPFASICVAALVALTACVPALVAVPCLPVLVAVSASLGLCVSLSPFVSFDLSTSFGGGVPLNDQFLISVVTFGSVQFGRGRSS